MREDFNKQLTERERIGHKRKFGDIRNAKANKVLDEEMSGGKESVHTRRRHAKGMNGGRKSFNENLNPLRSFLHTNLGRPWDKIYSEITTAFDKRKVINNHILEHLFQYVELDVHIIDGKPCSRKRWRSTDEFYELESSGRMPTYYVDPRDGLLKTPKRKKTKKQRDGEAARKAQDQLDRIYRRIDADNHLVYQDGVWWLYQAKDKPAQLVEYHQTPEWALTQPAGTGYYALSTMWNALPQAEKEKHGKKVLVDAPMRDSVGTPDVPGFYKPGSWYRSGPRMIPDTKYFYSRTTAPHKLLKAAGVDGTISTEEPEYMSHREASKYRPKKAGKK